MPRLGRSLTTDYTITGEHMANRSYLFITIALGESILVIGSQFRGHVPPSRLAPIGALVALIAVAVVSTVLVLLLLATAVVVGAACWSSRVTR